jgi:DNA-binding transcriptional LysR family regulator
LSEEQTFRIGACATLLQHFVLPLLARTQNRPADTRPITEVVDDAEIESRLHELTLDFGVVITSTLSRPLRLVGLGAWQLQVWSPRMLAAKLSAKTGSIKGRLPFALPLRELAGLDLESFVNYEPRLVCDSFLEAKVALEQENLATILPDFLGPREDHRFVRLKVPKLERIRHRFHLAWNPRLLRLNPHAVRWRDFLSEHLAQGV